MKKLLIIFCFLTIIVVGCRYKEGPLISFRSVYTRINGDWQIIGLTSNGVDSLQYYNDSCGSIIKFMSVSTGSSDKDYHIVLNFQKTNVRYGSISFFNNNSYLNVNFGYTYTKIIGPIGFGNSKWKILKLTMDALKISTDFNGRNYKISFKK